MKIEIKSYGIQFIKDIVPIVAGILIALFIDNWNAQRKDKVYINQVFTTINHELKETEEDIKTTIPQQMALIDSLDFYLDNQDVAILDIVMKSKGIFIPKIKINAWKSVATTKIDLVDYEKVTTLSTIEEQKETLSNKSDFLMSYLYSNIKATNSKEKQTFKMILMDIIQTENTIQEYITLFQEEQG